MEKEIYISESMGESRIAIIEDGTLVEVYVEKQDQQRMVGNIYKGKVENVLPGMQAAFVDIGYDINAFLPFSEIENPAYLMDMDESEDSNGKNKSNRKSNRRSNDNVNVDLKTGQSIFVQVIKEAFAGKGPRVTTEVAIPGRLLVLVPNAKYVGISKKIWDKYERRRLKKLVSSLKDKDAGIIVRTVAEGKSEELIKNDLQNLEKNWQKLLKTPLYVPENTSLNNQLKNFQKEKKRVGVIVDEYGDVEGLITLRDIIQIVVGELSEDLGNTDIMPQADGTFLIDGSLMVREINRRINWELPTNGPKTLSGLLLESAQSIPEANVGISIEGYRFETILIKDNVVKLVKGLKLQTEEEEDDDD